ncbi:MAG: type I phosphomannose isomerase catalytic subunit [Oligoflexus sp.]
MSAIYTNPIVLDPLNFTPLARTPWGGQKIIERYKSAIPGVQELEDKRVGESWEFSCDPDFPSKTLDGQYEILELVRQYPTEILSQQLLRQGSVSCEILVKLLNAASPLSLQVHPQDDDPYLLPHECGKPESWLILDVEPGAGLYLGFSQAISREELARRLKKGDDAKDLLQFVPVKKGDYFEIEPGVPHAIGAGVTLLEPQRIVFGKSGKTYRLWDWGRKYDSQGQLDPEHGKARELHLDEALRLVDSTKQVGLEWVNGRRRQAVTSQLSSGLMLAEYPANAYYQVRSLHGAKDEVFKIRADHGYAIILVLQGRCRLQGSGTHQASLETGYSALIPDQCWPLSVEVLDDQTDVYVIQPAATMISISID